jgi:hypothetical protein
MSADLVSVNGTVDSFAVQSITESDARSLVDRIRSHINDARALVLELYEKEGWKALGYKNWTECTEREFPVSSRHVFRLLDAAQTERNITDQLTSKRPIAESVLRPLASLEPDQQREAWASATASNPKPTAAQVEKAVESLTGKQGARSRLLPQDLARIETEDRERQQRERATILFYQCVLLFDPCAMGVEALTDHLLAVVDLKILPERLLKERLEQCSTVFSAIASKWND